MKIRLSLLALGAMLCASAFAQQDTVYVRMDLNERPTPIIPGRDDIYVPWSEVRRHMLHCIEQ